MSASEGQSFLTQKQAARLGGFAVFSGAEDLNAEKSVRQGAAGRRKYAGQQKLKGDAGRER